MIKKIAISSIIVLLLISPTAHAQDVPKVSKFSYSDDLKAGDKFAWEVSSTYTVQDPLFRDGSQITLEVLQDLAGKEFSGDLESSELPDYFDLDFGDSAFVSGEEAVHVVVFPDMVELENGTTLEPMKGFWVDVLIDQIDVSDAVVVSASAVENGDFLTVQAEVEYSLSGVGTVTSKIIAKINTKLGITEEYNLDLKLPLSEQKLDVVRVDVAGETSSSTQKDNEDNSESDDATVPINSLWIVIPFALIPLIRKYK